MFNASYFSYDGIFSGEYGLRIASFETDSMQTTEQPEPNITTVKPSNGRKFYLAKVDYTEAPTYQFTVISDVAIDPESRRAILSWLNGRKSYKELVFHQTGFNDITYRCIFSVTGIRYHKGECIGFDLTGTFDSPYQKGESLIKQYEGNGTAGTIIINNQSDILDGYIYPTITFKATAELSTGENIIIQNLTDDPAGTRKFFFKNIPINSEVTVNNELKLITASMGGDLLQNFCYEEGEAISQKNWLRLRHGKNQLSITINGTVTLECPQYVKLGF